MKNKVRDYRKLYEQYDFPAELHTDEALDVLEWLEKLLAAAKEEGAREATQNTLEVIESIRRITNSLYEVQQRLENENN